MAKVLIIEDNEMNRDMLSRRLVRHGWEVITAADGREGIDAAISNQPDLILMDLSLPLINGWEAAGRLNADVRTSSIPILALTAHAMSGDRAKAIAAGCSEFETKPIDMDRLLAKMDALSKGAENA